jgi:hypothetical protein
MGIIDCGQVFDGDAWGHYFGNWANATQGIISATMGAVAAVMVLRWTQRGQQRLSSEELGRQALTDAHTAIVSSLVGVADDASHRQDLERIRILLAKIEMAAALTAREDFYFAFGLQRAAESIAGTANAWDAKTSTAIERYDSSLQLLEQLIDVIPSWIGGVSTRCPFPGMRFMTRRQRCWVKLRRAVMRRHPLPPTA